MAELKTRPPAVLRAFIAIQPPPAIRAGVERVQRDIESRIRVGMVRWTPAEQIHLTLRFLGDIPADSVAEVATALRHACDRAAPFELSALALGCFPDIRRPRVLWMGLGGALDALQQLQRDVAVETKRWGEPGERPSHPHLTLGRVKAGRLRQLQDLGATIAALSSAPATNLGNWQVTQVELIRSELFQDGARHSRLAAVSLGRQ